VSQHKRSALEKFRYHHNMAVQHYYKQIKLARSQSPAMQQYADRYQHHLQRAYQYYRSLMQMLGRPYLNFHNFSRIDPRLDLNFQTQISPRLYNNLEINPFINIDPDFDIHIGNTYR